ncbi:hypothetical protein M427DRAFT_33045 [Gonapodya prolifera JEL478]|uniref:Uncharacterized protein n=1 Tax=Gonapodya prolifera (strain JEL478) TaxID=1344416 RepID=A0A139ADW2_GONPJ|nr:hypothetical protein M427DRAFT_33045 [Gonapodya prolifera JEL478]|eukprot:KXS14603.1 hypothetical protein M427DRAFT_33045 [Gonapodya prolifera JEL478]
MASHTEGSHAATDEYVQDGPFLTAVDDIYDDVNSRALDEREEREETLEWRQSPSRSASMSRPQSKNSSRPASALVAQRSTDGDRGSKASGLVNGNDTTSNLFQPQTAPRKQSFESVGPIEANIVERQSPRPSQGHIQTNGINYAVPEDMDLDVLAKQFVIENASPAAGVTQRPSVSSREAAGLSKGDHHRGSYTAPHSAKSRRASLLGRSPSIGGGSRPTSAATSTRTIVQTTVIAALKEKIDMLEQDCAKWKAGYASATSQLRATERERAFWKDKARELWGSDDSFESVEEYVLAHLEVSVVPVGDHGAFSDLATIQRTGATYEYADDLQASQGLSSTLKSRGRTAGSKVREKAGVVSTVSRSSVAGGLVRDYVKHPGRTKLKRARIAEKEDTQMLGTSLLPSKFPGPSIADVGLRREEERIVGESQMKAPISRPSTARHLTAYQPHMIRQLTSHSAPGDFRRQLENVRVKHLRQLLLAAGSFVAGRTGRGWDGISYRLRKGPPDDPRMRGGEVLPDDDPAHLIVSALEQHVAELETWIRETLEALGEEQRHSSRLAQTLLRLKSRLNRAESAASSRAHSRSQSLSPRFGRSRQTSRSASPSPQHNWLDHRDNNRDSSKLLALITDLATRPESRNSASSGGGSRLKRSKTGLTIPAGVRPKFFEGGSQRQEFPALKSSAPSATSRARPLSSIPISLEDNASLSGKAHEGDDPRAKENLRITCAGDSRVDLREDVTVRLGWPKGGKDVGLVTVPVM